VNISQNVRPNEKKTTSRENSFTFQVARVLQKHKVPFFPKEVHYTFVRLLKFTKFFTLGKEEGTPLRLFLDFWAQEELKMGSLLYRESFIVAQRNTGSDSKSFEAPANTQSI
jgi:hypothetical protein